MGEKIEVSHDTEVPDYWNEVKPIAPEDCGYVREEEFQKIIHSKEVREFIMGSAVPTILSPGWKYTGAADPIRMGSLDITDSMVSALTASQYLIDINKKKLVELPGISPKMTKTMPVALTDEQIKEQSFLFVDKINELCQDLNVRMKSWEDKIRTAFIVNGNVGPCCKLIADDYYEVIKKHGLNKSMHGIAVGSDDEGFLRIYPETISTMMLFSLLSYKRNDENDV